MIFSKVMLILALSRSTPPILVVVLVDTFVLVIRAQPFHASGYEPNPHSKAYID